MNEGMEALRQIATTSLFMQNEQSTSKDLFVPMMKEAGNSTGKANQSNALNVQFK